MKKQKKSVSFGELLAEYNSKKGWGISTYLKKRRFVEVTEK